MKSVDFAIDVLNTIEVKGKDNLDKLLAAIVALEQLKKGQTEINITESVTFDNKDKK